MAEIEKKTKRYPTDLTDEEWARIEPFLPGAAKSDLTTADISDSAGAQMILDNVRRCWPWLKHLFADSAYDRAKLMDKAAFLASPSESSNGPIPRGFEVLPRRWVVERTFGWMTRRRRLVRDYEERIDCSQAMIHVALGSILLRRISHQ